MVSIQRLSIKMLIVRRLTTMTKTTTTTTKTTKPPYIHMFFDLNNPDINPILNTLEIENHKISKPKSNNRPHKIEMHESHSVKPFIFKKDD